jgi:hypothetical protein
MATRIQFVLLTVAALGLAGCATLTPRRTYLASQLDDFPFPASCDSLWPQALKVLADHDCLLVGPDRVTAGQPERGALANFISFGHASTKDARGVIEAETDYVHQARYRVRGVPEGIDHCRVTYTEMKRANESMEIGLTDNSRDYDLELVLLSRVSPTDAARIEGGAPK